MKRKKTCKRKKKKKKKEARKKREEKTCEKKREKEKKRKKGFVFHPTTWGFLEKGNLPEAIDGGEEKNLKILEETLGLEALLRFVTKESNEEQEIQPLCFYKKRASQRRKQGDKGKRY